MEVESISKRTVPDGGCGWVVVFGSFMAHVIADGISFSFGVFVEDLVDYFESSKSAVGGVGSLMIGMTFFAGPFMSAMTNKFGCRFVSIASTLIAFFGLIISLWAPNIWFLYVSFGCVVGIGLSITNVPAIVVLSLYFHEKLSLATGTAICGNGVGVFIFSPLANSLLSEYSWKGTVLIEAGILLNCIVCGMLFRPLKIARIFDEVEVVKQVVTPAETVTEQQKPMNASSAEVPAIGNKSVSYPELSLTQGVQLCQSRKSPSSSANQTARTDILYAKSLGHIPQMQADFDADVQNITLLQKEPGPPGGLATDTTHQTTATKTMEFRLLLDVVFILFATSNFLTGFGYVIPYIFLPNRGSVLGFDSSQSSWLVSMLGISNIIGRVVTGLIANLKCVNKLAFYNTARVIWGISSLLSVLMWTFPLQMCYSCVFGFINGVYFCLTPLILVDLLGVEKLSNSYGFVLLFRGAGVIAGPPFAGWLYDISESYDNTFYVTGICLVISGLMLLPIPCIQRWQRSRSTNETPLGPKL